MKVRLFMVSDFLVSITLLPLMPGGARPTTA